MSSYFVSTQRNWLWVSVAALVLLVVALVLPQLAWADHASDHVDDQASISPSASMSSVLSLDLLRHYNAGELVSTATGRGDDRSPTASMSSAQTDAAFLSANPEAVVFQRFVSAQQEVAAGASSARWVALGAYHAISDEVAAAASSARWVALGEFYTDSVVDLLAEFHTDSNAAFLAANPEIRAFRYNLAQQDCSEASLQC